MALQWFHNFASLVELTSEVSWKTTGSLEELEINFLEASICQLVLFLFTICLEPGNLHEQLLLTLTKRGSRSRFSLVFLPKMSFFHILLLFSTYNAPAIYKDFKTILRKRNYPIGILRWCLRHLEDWGLRRVRSHVWAWLSKTWWKSGNTVNKKTIFTW